MSYLKVKNVPVSFAWYSSSCKLLYVWCWTHLLLKTLLPEIGFFEAGMTQCIFCIPGSVWASLNLSSGIIVSWLWSSTLQYSEVTERIYTTAHQCQCLHLHLIRVLQTCLSSCPFNCSPNSITCTFAMWYCWEVALSIHMKINFMTVEIDEIFPYFILWGSPIRKVVNLSQISQFNRKKAA